MTAERDLLAELRDALAAADVDASELVETAWTQARDEVAETLRRLMVRDLLQRALGQVQSGHDAAPPAAPPAQTAAPTASSEPPAGDTVTYVFGITRLAAPVPGADAPRLPGGGPVTGVEVGGLRALVCELDAHVLAILSEPGPEGLDTLADAARAHDAVLAAAAQVGTVLPLRLGTVVTDETAAAELLERHGEELHAELTRVDGHAEWAVTVQLLQPADDAEADDGAAVSGRDYLDRRQALLQAKERRRTSRAQLAGDVHERLAATAADAQRVTARPMEDVAPPLLHGVYLLDAEQLMAFDAVVDTVRAEHPEAMVEVSGPWPPYHFTSVRIGAEHEDAS